VTRPVVIAVGRRVSAATAVDGLPDDVGVAGVTSGLLDHVHRYPSQVLVGHLRPRTRRVEIEAAQDLA